MRLYLAAKWSLSPVYMQIAEWPPLYSVVYGTFLKIPWPPLLMGHVLTGVFCGATLIVCFKLAEKLSSSGKAGILVGALILINPLFFRLILSTLSEAMYLFLVASFIFSFHAWYVEKKMPHFYLSSMIAMLMTMTRIDSWIPLSLLSLCLIFLNRDAKSALFFLVTVFFPILWTIEITKRSGSPWSLHSAYAEDSQEFYGDYTIPYLNLALDTMINAPWLLGLPWLAMKKKRQAWKPTQVVALAALVVALIQVAITWKKLPTIFAERIFLSPILLATICVGIYFDSILTNKKKASLVFCVLLFLVIQLYRHPPTYDRESYALAVRLANSPAWKQIQQTQRIGTNLGTDRWPSIALRTDGVHNAHHVFVDQETGRMYLPFPSPTFFLMDSQENTDKLIKKFPGLSGFTHRNFSFVAETRNPMLRALQKELTP